MSQAGTARQSSTYRAGFEASNAIDGNRGGAHRNDPISHTLDKTGDWWEVDLGEELPVSAINIWNRTDCCSDRLDGVRVAVSASPYDGGGGGISSGATWTTLPAEATGSVVQADVPDVVGRYVQIQVPEGDYLNMGEVDVFVGSDTDGDGIGDASDTVVTTGTDVAEAGTASQSGLYRVGLEAVNAIDGNRGGSSPADPISHTLRRDQPWWEVDLGRSHVINTVNVFNRTDSGTDRLADFDVLVSDTPFGDADLAEARGLATWSTTFAGTAGAIAQFEVPSVAGRYVRLQLAASNQILNIGEVDVFGVPAGEVDTDGDGIPDVDDTVATTGADVAEAGSATQSSLSAPGFEASNAIDGNRGGQFPVDPVTETAEELEAWIDIDLGDTHTLEGINIFNRTDCCSDRLADFDVLVSDTPFGPASLADARAQATWSTTSAGPAGRFAQFELADINGRYVRIQLAGTGVLSLAEVDVFGELFVAPLPPFGTPGNVVLETDGVGEVSVSWDEVADVKGYVIHRDFEFVKWVPVGSSSWVDTSVVQGESYRYQVRAQAPDNSYSRPSPVQSILVGAEDETPPDAPLNVVAARSPDGTEITLTWDAAVDDVGVSSYLIHDNWNYLTFVSGGTTSYTHTGLDPDSVHRYQVRARDAADNVSAPSVLVRVDPN